MLDPREEVRRFFEKATERPVRWADSATTLGDFDARNVALEIFDVAARDELNLLRVLRSAREWAATKLGVPVVIVFHTPKETDRLYAWVRGSASQGWTDAPEAKAIRSPSQFRRGPGAEAAGFAADRVGCPPCS